VVPGSRQYDLTNINSRPRVSSWSNNRATEPDSEWEKFIMRVLAFAIIGALAVGVSAPASAAKKAVAAAPSVGTYEACETKALALGMPHGQVGHSEYVRECMGKRPRNSHNPN
jgi:hypothetical protein